MISEIPEDVLNILKSVVSEKIEEYDLEMVTNEKGQGFVAEIVFLTLIHKKTQSKYQLIIKEELKSSGTNEKDFNLLVSNEIAFYETIWPFLHEYYKTASGNDLTIVPKCFGTSNTGRKRIIMENIRPQGYELYDKKNSFDDDHFRKIFTNYGIYHAISMALREKDFEQYKKFTNLLSNMYEVIFNGQSNFGKNFIECFREAQQYFNHVTEKHLVDKLRFYEMTGMDLISNYVNEDFAKGVIIHGDCWSNNMMFRYDEQRKLRDIKMLDFQAVCHGTPIFDLSYCFYSGTSEEALEKLDDYLKIYHNSLSKTLNEFNLSAQSIYSFETLKEEWKTYSKSGFTIGLYIWKLKLAEDLPELDEDFTAPIELNDRAKDAYKKKIRGLVVHMYDNDFL